MMTTNLFVIPNVKQLRTGGSFRILLFFFSRTYWGVGVLNSTIFKSFHNRIEFGTILECIRNWGRGFEPPTPSRYATVSVQKRTHYRLSMATLLVFVSRFVAKFDQHKWPDWYMRLEEPRPECTIALHFRKFPILFKTRSIKKQKRMV